jgi:polysaccharide pyruvyl transferase CsaB
MNDKPIRLLLAGYFGFDNAGDEAIFESVVENFRRLEPNVQLTALVSGDETAKRLGVETVPRKDVGAVWKALRSHDLFVLGGGGLFQDVTGPGSVFYYGGLLIMAALARCPSVFFCQGYGPVRRPLQKLFTKQVLRLPTLITIRDEESKAELHELGISQDRVHLAADPALLLSPLPTNEIRGLLKEENLVGELGRSELPNGQLSPAGPLVAVTVRPWPGLPLEQLGDALRKFREEVGARYILLPFQPERDLEPSKRLVELLNGEARLIERELSPAALTGVLACSDMVIGMRLHSLILATVGNPPLYGLSYDPKVERFCRRAGALSCNIEEISSERLLKEWVHVLNGRKAQRKCQEKAVSRMRGEAELAFRASLALARGQSREVAEQLMMSSPG